MSLKVQFVPLCLCCSYPCGVWGLFYFLSLFYLFLCFLCVVIINLFFVPIISFLFWSSHGMVVAERVTVRSRSARDGVSRRLCIGRDNNHNDRYVSYKR